MWGEGARAPPWIHLCTWKKKKQIEKMLAHIYSMYNHWTIYSEGSRCRLYIVVRSYHPGGGGGGAFHICTHIEYVPRKDPHFQPLNFHSGAYHFHKWQKYSAPEHHHITFFAAPETIIFTISLGSSHLRRPRMAYSGRPECQLDASYSQLQRPPLSRSSSLRSPPCIFHFSAAHTYPNLGRVPPPPPKHTTTYQVWRYMSEAELKPLSCLF